MVVDGGPGGSASPARQQIAYFSMEIALSDAVPTYSGGLGVLAGDHVRAAADQGLAMVAVTLLYHEGYFDQELDGEGRQREHPARWSPGASLARLPCEVDVEIGGRRVRVGAWRAAVAGVTGEEVPVYLLDTRLPANEPEDQAITDRLYGGDEAMRLRQEVVLGQGGVALLEALGLEVGTYHMNEGHSALLALGLLSREEEPTDPAAWDAVRARCVFTTHTPVPAGHDRFDRHLVEELLGAEAWRLLDHHVPLPGGRLDMTELALAASRWSNAVSRRHREVAATMFPGRRIRSITNGVHAATWVAGPMARLFDRHVPGWRRHNATLRYVREIPLEEIAAAHAEAKALLVAEVERRAGTRFDPDALTLGIARRSTAYKRPDLVLADPARLGRLVEEVGPLQIVFAGKAHPKDGPGKELIRRIVAAARQLRGTLPVCFLEGYGMDLARLLCAGTDVWCNTPRPPYEASGTSGMKAALNGVPSLSILDGWWIEGHIEGVTGWSVGREPAPVGSAGAGQGDPSGDLAAADAADRADAASLYDKLSSSVGPLFYRHPDRFAEVRRHAIALNGSWFTTERMVREYWLAAYEVPGTGPPGPGPAPGGPG